MKHPLLNLAVVLLTILLVSTLGTLALFFSHETNNFYGVALSIILITIVLTFISYLVYDLYSSMQEEEHQEQEYTTYKRLT